MGGKGIKDTALVTNIGRRHVRILNHHAANASHSAQAVCCVLNWNIFVLKQNSMATDKDYVFPFFQNCKAKNKNKISMESRNHPCLVHLNGICYGC